MKRFVLNIFTNGELDEVIEGLNNINEHLRSILDNPPLEDTTDEFEDMYSEELEEEND